MMIKNFIIIACLAFSIGEMSFWGQEASNIDYIHISMSEDYKSDWKKVEEEESKGLTKSANELVNAILVKAKKEDNFPQIAKALLFGSKYDMILQEEAEESVLTKWEKEANQAQFPLKQLLHTITADLYWQYYQKNQWRFARRSAVQGVELDNPATWDLSKIVEKVIEQHQLALSESDQTQRIKLDEIEAILNKGNSRRSTLYDFIAHRAIDQMIHAHTSLAQPVAAYQIAGEEYFSDASSFSK